MKKIKIGNVRLSLLPCLMFTVGCSSFGYSSFHFVKDKMEYQKVLEDRSAVLDWDARLHDVYQTIDDKNIELSVSAINAISEISSFHFDSDYVDLFGIDVDSVTDAYAQFVDVKPKTHRFSRLYDEKHNDIDWELATTVIIDNSHQYVNLHPAHFHSFSGEELMEKIETLKMTTEQVKEDFPDYDLRMLACNLEEVRIVKSELEDSTVIAQVSGDSIIYNEKNKVNSTTDAHESFHFLIHSCKDVDSCQAFSRAGDGIGINTLSLKGPGDYQDGYLNRFHYTFLEEIYAELYAADVMDTQQQSYIWYDEVLTLIQLTLGLQDDYKIDAILKDLVYRDSLSFINHFPVYGEDEDNFFVRNCQMLKSFGVLLKDSQWYSSNLEEQALDDTFKEQGVFELKRMALDQIEQIFFNNLIVLNETHSDEMDLDTNIQLMRLFSKYKEKANFSLTRMACLAYSSDYGTTQYVRDSNCYSYLDIMFHYLSEVENVDCQDISSLYFSYNDEKLPYLSALGEEKNEFYQQLSTIYSLNNEEPYSIKLQKTGAHNLLTNGKR